MEASSCTLQSPYNCKPSAVYMWLGNSTGIAKLLAPDFKPLLCVFFICNSFQSFPKQNNLLS